MDDVGAGDEFPEAMFCVKAFWLSDIDSESEVHYVCFSRKKAPARAVLGAEHKTLKQICFLRKGTTRQFGARTHR